MRKNKCIVYDMEVGAYLKCVDTVGSRRQREREQMGVRPPPPGAGPPLFTQLNS